MHAAICRFAVLVSLVASPASAGHLRIIASRTAPGNSPLEFVIGAPQYQTVPTFSPGETVYIWAQASPGLLFVSIGVDLDAYEDALIDGPVVVPNPSFSIGGGHYICRWNGYVAGTPMLPPSTSYLKGIKMVCIPIPGQTCQFVGVSNPVNPLNRPDGYNDTFTQSVMVASFKAAGSKGHGYFVVNPLLIVDYPDSNPRIYFGWDVESISGKTAGARSNDPDWYVSEATLELTDSGLMNVADSTSGLIMGKQLDSEGPPCAANSQRPSLDWNAQKASLPIDTGPDDVYDVNADGATNALDIAAFLESAKQLPSQADVENMVNRLLGSR